MNKFATEKWLEAKLAAIQIGKEVRESKEAAAKHVKASCGQVAWNNYCHAWNPDYDSFEFQLFCGTATTDKHWTLTLSQVLESTEKMKTWTTPEAWLALWASQQ